MDTKRTRVVLIMVGLPGRGKTYYSRKLARYLNWIGIRCRVFTVGNYRRARVGEYKGDEFFDVTNFEAMTIREQCAAEAQADVAKWFAADEKAVVAVYDATNTTRQRRHELHQFCLEYNFKAMYCESLCENTALITKNVEQLQVTSPDYRTMEKGKVVFDFNRRVDHYRTHYETLDAEFDKRLSFIKIIETGETFQVNNVHGHIQSKIVYYLINSRVTLRTIYLSRHGETNLNVSGRIGGDGVLSPNGLQYSYALYEFIQKQKLSSVSVWTSQLLRTVQTAERLNIPIVQWKALNEIDAGVCEGLSYEEVKDRYPVEFAMRDENKFHFRYPLGESYEDLVTRLEPVIIELERKGDVVVICHQAVMRCLLAYFLDLSYDELPYIECPLHTVVKLTPVAYGCQREDFALDVPAVDTHRPKPSVPGNVS